MNIELCISESVIEKSFLHFFMLRFVAAFVENIFKLFLNIFLHLADGIRLALLLFEI